MRLLSARYFIVYAVLFLIVTGCGKEYLSEADLAKYVSDNDNGLTKSVQSGQTRISVSWQPNDLLVARELRNKKLITPGMLREARAKYAGQHYFILRLSQSGKEIVTPTQVGIAGFSELLQTLSFGMADKVLLVGSKRDTTHVADYVYSRTFGAATSSDVLFAFKKNELDPGSSYIEFNLDEFGLGTSKRVFRFEVEDLNEAPGIFDEEELLKSIKK
ncbi:MAG TPA: hypothetical protein VFE50_16345 [Cyclobacteriaceae bacterium]|nr:hypothetical protein [Cyclobacteriaceae bacterium]